PGDQFLFVFESRAFGQPDGRGMQDPRGMRRDSEWHSTFPLGHVKVARDRASGFDIESESEGVALLPRIANRIKFSRANLVTAIIDIDRLLRFDQGKSFRVNSTSRLGDLVNGPFGEQTAKMFRMRALINAHHREIGDSVGAELHGFTNRKFRTALGRGPDGT